MFFWFVALHFCNLRSRNISFLQTSFSRYNAYRIRITYLLARGPKARCQDVCLRFQAKAQSGLGQKPRNNQCLCHPGVDSFASCIMVYHFHMIVISSFKLDTAFESFDVIYGKDLCRFHAHQQRYWNTCLFDSGTKAYLGMLLFMRTDSYIVVKALSKDPYPS